MKELIWKLTFLFVVLTKWIFRHFRLKNEKENSPIHILFCMIDHYEPGTGKVAKEVEIKRIDNLVLKYPQLVARHRDYYGNLPKRTWFFTPHYHRNGSLKKLVQLYEQGYGEIELHLHHGKSKPDTAENLRDTLLQCVNEYSKLGIFGSENGKKRYGFVHGDWALDNSRNGKFCGVNNELQILKETGCYADFTFPSVYTSTPLRMMNTVYYARDDPKQPKSYSVGKEVEYGKPGNGDLMIIQGPLFPFLKGGKLTGICVFNDVIDGRPPVTEKRIDAWIKTGIHVKGKPDWIIVKLHTHGATDEEAVLGDEMNAIFNYLESKYNDGYKYILHYVTARELYNIIRALEDGQQADNPEKFRNYKISPPKYDSSPAIYEASPNLLKLVYRTYSN